MGEDDDPSESEDESIDDDDDVSIGEDPADLKYLTIDEKEVRVASPYVEFVYFMQVLGVQMFMSYDGGAVNATNLQLKLSTGMTDNELDILQAIDKFAGFFGIFWQMAFPFVPTKWLLLLGLGLNCFASSMFAWCDNKWWLIFAKLLQGATEALQQLWFAVWTLKNAPPAQKHWWVSAGGSIAAAMGNVIGMCVGFSVSTYQIAYWVQSIILALFWLQLLLTPRRLLQVPREKEVKAEPCWVYLREVSKNLLYNCTMWTVVLSSFNTAIILNSAQRFLQLGPWPLPTYAADWVQASFAIATGVGFVIAQVMFSRREGGDDTVGTYVRVSALMQLQAVAVCGAGLAAVAMGSRMISGPFVSVARESAVLSDPWLWLFIAAINPVLAVNQGIDAVTPEINFVSILNAKETYGRADVSNFAVSLTGTCKNLGNAFGAMVPGWFIALLGQTTGHIPNSYEYAFRYATSLALTVPMALLLARATCYTKAQVEQLKRSFNTEVNN